jgi:predicted AAA+ superfamily ATPase
MTKIIIEAHRKEKEEMVSRAYIEREKLSFAKKFLETDLIKVITGPRRAGKSVFATMFLKEKNFAYLNFDDENLIKLNGDEILKGCFEVYGDVKFFLFDEIQNFNNWELFVNRLQRRGFNITITGSNAKLLSKELSTSLTGRHIPIEILPFSFREFLRAKNFDPKESNLPENKGKILNYLTEFIKTGGYPEIVVKNLEAKTYLDTLADAVLLKDVVKRYRVKFSQKIYDLFLYLVSNFASEFTFTSLKKNVNFNSVNTVQNYLSYLEEAYLLLSLNRFSYSVKEQIKAAKKCYLVDNGLALAKSFQFSRNIGRAMENLFFTELLKRGLGVNKNIFYYKTRNHKEVDFILKEGTKVKALYQVVWDISSPQTLKREIKSLIEAGEELDCNNLTIITWDEEGETKVKGKKIKLIPLWKWLCYIEE